jgi:hypothetical protein
MGSKPRSIGIIHSDMSITAWPPRFLLWPDGRIEVIHDSNPRSEAANYMEVLEAWLNIPGKTIEIEDPLA